jgi:hypothetical protein
MERIKGALIFVHVLPLERRHGEGQKPLAAVNTEVCKGEY